MTAKGTATDAVSGFGLVFASNMATRLIGLGGQIIVGWLLLPEDFGAYALALAFTTAVGALRGGGAQQIMIKNPDTLERDSAAYFRYSLSFNLLATAVLAALAIPYLTSSSAVGWVLIGTALSLPIGTHASIYRAKLTIDRRFKDIAVVNLCAALSWQTSVVVLAVLGLGAGSFAFAPIVQAVAEFGALYFYAGRTLQFSARGAPTQSFHSLFRAGFWMMLSAAMVALASTGHYFAIDWFADARTVGIFFFAFQLIVSLTTPIYMTIESVVPTLLTRLESQRERQNAAYARTVAWICVIATPLSFLLALSLPVLVRFAWQDKWNEAIPYAQCMCACAPAWLLVSTARSLIEARGRWKLRFVVIASYGVGGIVATAIGATVGDLSTIALAISVFYVAFAVILIAALRLSGVTDGPSMRPLIVAPALCVISAVLASWCSAKAVSPSLPSAHFFLDVILFLLFCGIANYLCLRNVWADILNTLATRFSLPWPAPVRNAS